MYKTASRVAATATA